MQEICSAPDIGDYIESINGEALSDIVSRKERLWGCSPVPCFIPGYIASTRCRYDQVTGFLADRLAILREDIMELSLRPSDVDYLRVFMEERSRFERILGETAFVKVNGFVDLARLAYSPRTAHDFDQDLERLLPGVHKGYGFAGENPYLWGFDKRVIIAAHLDVSSDNYQIAFESASSSGFQMFLWAFAPGSDIKIR